MDLKWTKCEICGKEKIGGLVACDCMFRPTDIWENKPKAMDKQEGGSHYKKFAIQPTEFSQKNELNWCEANVVKYVCRHRDKNGLEDLKKAIHYIEMLIELEGYEEN